MELERGAARFATWPARRRRGERIPAALWELAVDLAVLHGVSRTAHRAKRTGIILDDRRREP
jgi:hypothetical protein